MSIASLLQSLGSAGRQQVLRLAFRMFERLAPADRSIWAFCTWHGEFPHTMDNPRAVFEEIKHDSSIRKVILCKRHHRRSDVVVEGSNVVVVDVESVRGAWLLSRAKFLLVGFGLHGVCSYSSMIGPKHHIIQLWHGIPLKRIGKLFPGEKHWATETPRYAATVCSSPRDKEIMGAAFEPLPPERVWQSGLPRNDFILKEEVGLPADYRAHLVRLRARLSGRRFVLYAPTWRDSENGIYSFSDAERRQIESVLAKHGAVLGIRAHANRRLQHAYPDDAKSAIFLVNDYPDVNVILRVTDVLVTDYSSIYIDFLITGRPVVFFTYDLESYIKERGFLYDLNEAFPCDPAKNFAEFVARLDEALAGRGIDKARYESVRTLFHQHPESPSADVVARLRRL